MQVTPETVEKIMGSSHALPLVRPRAKNSVQNRRRCLWPKCSLEGGSDGELLYGVQQKSSALSPSGESALDRSNCLGSAISVQQSSFSQLCPFFLAVFRSFGAKISKRIADAVGVRHRC